MVETRTWIGARGAPIIAALTLAVGGLAACSSAAGDSNPESAHVQQHALAGDESASAQLNDAMRSLWAQHMEWTYAAVVAFASDSPGLQPTIDRLLQNQVDIGQAVSAYYGRDAGGQLTEMLTTHIKEAVPVLVAAKAGDEPALTKAVDDWYANAQSIADFLSNANPAWGQQDMRDMMKTHITQTIAYASDVLAGKYAASISKYNEAERHMTDMADMLSAGIETQFSEKF